MEETLTRLLSDWCDGLLRQQIDSPGDKAQHGGLFCPDCKRIHGRCADALYPLLRMARQTGDEKYLTAAQLVFEWSERNVSQANGSFINDPDGNNWTGITVFSTIALAEGLYHHGALLPKAVRERWTERLARAARWISTVDWADHGTINYPISAAAALACASRALHDPALLETARHWADWAGAYFLPNGILFGEGPRTLTARGVYAVDALYNVEESLPNLALYAEIVGDETARVLVLQSFAAHLDFLLPDGFYDAGWGSRSFKWTLWGSRTSDGIAGLLPLAHRDARIFEAVRRNVDVLRGCTHNGLLYGGPHLKAQNRPPCIHHTFCHAKALAAALDGGVLLGAQPVVLPSDTPRGIVYHNMLGTTFVSLGDWRASFTVSDVLYQKPGLRPSGGALTMLWHKATGPLCVSSMSVYERIEGGNMAQAQSETEISVLTPRIDAGNYSSIFDEKAALTSSEDTVYADGHLTTLGGETTGTYRLETRFVENRVVFHAAAGQEAAFILPIVSPCDERVEWSPHRIVVYKSRARVVVEASAPITGSDERVFHFVPGVQAVRLAFPIPPPGLDVSLTVLADGN